MSLTNWIEFKKLYKQIPKNRLPFVRFIPLRNCKKVPLIKGTWKTINSTYDEVKKMMFCGTNIGVVCIPKGIMVWDLDVDENNKLYEPALAQELLECNTFTVQTRSKGLHFYFLNDGLYNTQDRKVNNINVGELRANWSYVVSGGSYVDIKDGKEGQYIVIKDCPIRPLPEKYKDYFEMGDTSNINKKEILHGKVGKPISEQIKKYMREAGIQI